MRDDSRRQLIYCIDQVAQTAVSRLLAISAPLREALGERANSEPSADRRKRLASLHTLVGESWRDAVAAFDEAYRHHAAAAAGLRQEAYGGEEVSVAALTLVDDDQVEWELAFSGAVMRMKAAGGDALAEAGQRLFAASIRRRACAPCRGATRHCPPAPARLRWRKRPPAISSA